MRCSPGRNTLILTLHRSLLKLACLQNMQVLGGQFILDCVVKTQLASYGRIFWGYLNGNQHFLEKNQKSLNFEHESKSAFDWKKTGKI